MTHKDNKHDTQNNKYDTKYDTNTTNMTHKNNKHHTKTTHMTRTNNKHNTKTTQSLVLTIWDWCYVRHCRQFTLMSLGPDVSRGRTSVVTKSEFKSEDPVIDPLGRQGWAGGSFNFCVRGTPPHRTNHQYPYSLRVFCFFKFQKEKEKTIVGGK